MAILKTRIRRMRTWIRRTRRIRRIQRIWWIRRIAQAIFKRFLSFIYSATKGFIFFSKLSSELYSYTWLKDEPQISRKESYLPRYLQYGVLGDCAFQFLVLMYIIAPLHTHTHKHTHTYTHTHIYIYYVHKCVYIHIYMPLLYKHRTLDI